MIPSHESPLLGAGGERPTRKTPNQGNEGAPLHSCSKTGAAQTLAHRGVSWGNRSRAAPAHI